MKRYILCISVYFLLLSFSSSEKRKIKIKKHTIIWKGTKVIGGGLQGTINLQDGYFLWENNTIVGGKFVIDMNSINCTDLKGKSKEKLEKHLKATHFFGVQQYPTSTFTITKVLKNTDATYQITGDFTIKNTTKANTFLLKVVQHTATGIITIKRNDYGIKYGSGFFGSIGNKAISNKFTLQIKLEY